MPRSAVGPLIASVVLIAVAGVVLALTGGSSEPQQAFTPRPTSEPAATATPAPTSGTLVYRRGANLWVASLDGGQALPPRAITTDSLAIGYAGHVSRADGGADVYYVRRLSETGDGEFGVYRVSLPDGMPEELLLALTVIVALPAVTLSVWIARRGLDRWSITSR